MVFYSHEPWGYEAEERRHAQSLATALNCIPRARGSKAIDWRDLYQDPWGDGETDLQKLTQEQREFLRKRKAKRTKGKA
jgi:hypothetical protein